MSGSKLDHRDWIAVLGLLFAFTPLLPVQSEWVKIAAAMAACFLILVFSRGLRRWIAGYRAGITGFWPEMNEKPTREFLRSISEEYCFFGLFYAEHLKDLESWHENDEKGHVRVRMLLIDPEPDRDSGSHRKSALELSLCHTEFLDPKQGRDLNSYRERGRSTIRELASLHRRGLNIEVRLHHEAVRFKVHVADGERIWLEAPRKGRHPSKPAHYRIEPNAKGGLHDHFSTYFESVWQSAAAVDLEKHWAKGAGL